MSRGAQVDLLDEVEGDEHDGEGDGGVDGADADEDHLGDAEDECCDGLDGCHYTNW